MSRAANGCSIVRLIQALDVSEEMKNILSLDASGPKGCLMNASGSRTASRSSLRKLQRACNETKV